MGVGLSSCWAAESPASQRTGLTRRKYWILTNPQNFLFIKTEIGTKHPSGVLQQTCKRDPVLTWMEISLVRAGPGGTRALRPSGSLWGHRCCERSTVQCEFRNVSNWFLRSLWRGFSEFSTNCNLLSLEILLKCSPFPKHAFMSSENN